MSGAGKTFQWERDRLCYYAIRVKPIFSHGTGAGAGVRARYIYAGGSEGVIEVAKKSVGRPRKMTEKEFAAGVCKYFRSITVGEVDADIITMDGEPLTRVVYVEPPTISALCLELGIDRRTWLNYADPLKNGGTERKPSGYSRICDDVKLRIEAYLERELLTREKSVQGIIFNLSNNYGWAEKHEHNQRVELGEETRKIVSQNLTLDEKFALIREAAAEIGAAEMEETEPEETEDGEEGG